MVIKSIEEIKSEGLKIDEFKEMSIYQTGSEHFILFVKEHAYPFSSVDMAQKSFEIVKRLWFDEDHNILRGV